MPSIACELEVILYGRDISIQIEITNKKNCCLPNTEVKKWNQIVL